MRRRLLVLGALALSACGPKTEEAKIKALLEKGTTAVEGSDVHGVMEFVADDFTSGDMDKQALKGVLASLLLRGEKVTVIRRADAVKVDGDKATADFDCALLSGDRKTLKGKVPNRVGTYHFTFSLAKRDGTWRVIKAERKDIPASSLIFEL